MPGIFLGPENQIDKILSLMKTASGSKRHKINKCILKISCHVFISTMVKTKFGRPQGVGGCGDVVVTILNKVVRENLRK